MQSSLVERREQFLARHSQFDTREDVEHAQQDLRRLTALKPGWNPLFDDVATQISEWQIGQMGSSN
jgi:hypothetical protein